MTFQDQQPEFLEYHVTKKYDKTSHKLVYSNPDLRNKLIVQNQKLVSFVLNKMFTRSRKQKVTPELREELVQEGSLGLLSAVEGFDPTKGFKFSTYACVPTSTQILTQDGWKYYDEIKKDDKTLGYENGVSKWTPIIDVGTYDDAPLMRFGDDRWNVLCTPQHKWLVSKDGEVSLCPLDKWPSSKEFEYPTATKQSGKKIYKRPNIHLVTSAPYVGGSCELTPDEASVLAWILSDGSLYGGRHNPVGAVIIQSKKKFAHEIRELLKKIGAYSSDVQRGRGCLAFNVKASVFRTIWNKSKLNERSMSELVLDLTPEARSSWFQTWYMAEGTLGRRQITQNNSESLNALELCAFLEGNQEIHTRHKNNKCSLVGWHMRSRTPRTCRISYEKNDKVWCPKTGLGSWTARTEDGMIFLTGNTYWIEQSINSYLLHKQPIIDVPAHIRTARNKVLNTLREQGIPSREVFNMEAPAFGISKKMLKSIKAAINSKYVVSIYQPQRSFVSSSNGMTSSSLVDIMPDDQVIGQDIRMDKQTIITAFKKIFQDGLTEKERCVLLLRYDVVDSVPYLKKGEPSNK